MSKKKKKTIMRSFKIFEISGVDRPAQAPAKALLLKREDDMAKSYQQPRLLSDVKGHSHLLDLAEGTAGQTSYELASGADTGHSHPWIVTEAGDIVVGMAAGHTHNVLEKAVSEEEIEKMVVEMEDGFDKRTFSPQRREELARQGKAMPDGSYPIVTVADLKNAIRAFGRSKNKAAVAAHIKRRAKALKATDLLPEEGLLAMKSADGGGEDPDMEENMTQKKLEDAAKKLEAVQKKLEEQSARLAKAEAYGKLSDAEKAFFAKQDEEGQAAFLKMDADARAAMLAEELKADKVVYKSDLGVEYRASDDPRLVKLAKQADEDRRLAKAEREAREALMLEKRAEEELGNLPGEIKVKAALLKAVDSIKDEEARKGALELLKAGNKGLEKAFDRLGTTSAQAGDAAERYEALAKKYAEDHKVTIEKARAEVLRTPEGEAIALEMRG